MPSPGVNRRDFFQKAAAAVGGGALASTASSYGRIIGANDRISLGHIGIGSRGSELASIASHLKDSKNVEMTAVCDLWKLNREKASASAQLAYGRAPRAFQYMEQLLALPDVDAVIISTGDFQHSPILKMAVEAGKDAYCEKPMANGLAEAKAARDAVAGSKRIVQIGTQHRSEPYQIEVRNRIRQGVLGDVSKYEMEWNYHGPRWRGRPEVKQIREQDTDWKRWLLGKPDRPFDPQLYFEFRLYKDFSTGVASQWMSHGIDLAHFFMDDHFPRSVMAHGGIFAWHDGRENPDTFQALLEYPKGFLVSYATSFGNDCDSFSRIMGKKATLINIGGEGSPRWKIVQERGNHEDDPYIKRPEEWVKLPGDDRIPPTYISDNVTYHMSNWLDCLRSRRQPNATVHDGFAHSVAVLMAAQSYWQGRKLWWDPKTESILDHAPEA